MLNIKRTYVIPLILCCCLIVVSSLNINPVFAQEDISEAIELNIHYTGKNTYKLYKQKFTKVDLRPYVNRSFIDEVAGDGKGGWADQGENDFRTFTDRGAKEYLGIPFDIIEPNTNGGKSAIVLPGQGDTPDDCKNPVEINLNGAVAGGFYFLHTTAHAGDYVSGTYTINYTDGTSAYFDLLNSVHIYNNWGKNENILCRIAWQGPSAATSQGISLGLFAMNNPHPEKKIKSISASTSGYGPYLMIVGITLTDTAPALPAFSDDDIIHNPGTSTWNKYTPADDEKIKGSILDMSGYLDAPAGKHGRLSTNGDKFVFADGTPIKFRGTNLIGENCFPEKIIAEKLADAIAVCGYNIVRFTEFDGKDGILCADGTTIDNDKLNKMSYFIYCLEQKGIYTYLTFTSKREVSANIDATDGGDVANGFKLKGFFDDGLIQAQKKFVNDILTYESPYTKARLGDSKSLAMVEFMDSNTMFEYTSGYSDFSTHSKEYRNIIKSMFNEYIKNKYGNTEALKKVWKGEYDLQPHETIEDSTIELKSVWRDFLYSAQRIEDIQMFFAKIQLEYYDTMKNCLTENGFDVLSTCNSNPVGNIDTADSYVNSKTDFVSRKSIWPEPSAKNSKKLSDPMIMRHYNSVVSQQYGGLVGELAKNRISGSPYIVSSWAVLETSPFMSELPLVMSVVSAKQGWNSIEYSFVCENFDFDGEYKIDDFYSAYKHPVRMAMMPVSAALFYTTEEFKDENTLVYNEDEIYSFDNMDEYEKKELQSLVYDAKWYPNKWMYFYNPFIRISNHQLLGKKFGVSVEDKSTKKAIEAVNYHGFCEFDLNNYEKITSEEMIWDIKDNKFIVQTDNVQAATGILNGKLDLDNISFNLGIYTDASAWGSTVSLVSTDGKNVASSKRLLLSTVARAFNSKYKSSQVEYDNIIKSPKSTGMVYNQGEGPVMFEPVTGEFVLKLNGNYSVYALSSSGERAEKIRTVKNKSGISFTISGTNAVQHYEIVRDN